jgi:ribosomal protein S27AE
MTRPDGDNQIPEASEGGLPPGFVTITESDTPLPGTVYMDQVACPRCGAPVPIMVGSAEEGSTFSDVRVRCGNCGYRFAASGTHEVVRDDNGRLRMAFHDLTLDELRALQSRIRAAQDGGVGTAEDLAAAVEESSPGIAQWIRSQDNRMEVYQIVTVILALIAIFISLHPPSAAPTPAQINQVIFNIQDGHANDLPIPRRSPCFCGSGKRYKNCHGKYPGAGASVNPSGAW